MQQTKLKVTPVPTLTGTGPGPGPQPPSPSLVRDKRRLLLEPLRCRCSVSPPLWPFTWDAGPDENHERQEQLPGLHGSSAPSPPPLRSDWRAGLDGKEYGQSPPRRLQKQGAGRLGAGSAPTRFSEARVAGSDALRAAGKGPAKGFLFLPSLPPCTPHAFG